MLSVLALKETELVLLILSLVDMALVGGLLVMVLLSGYENFISSIDIMDGQKKLACALAGGSAGVQRWF